MENDDYTLLKMCIKMTQSANENIITAWNVPSSCMEALYVTLSNFVYLHFQTPKWLSDDMTERLAWNWLQQKIALLK